jgi:hypothetical protein
MTDELRNLLEAYHCRDVVTRDLIDRIDAEFTQLQSIIEHCRRYAPSVVAAAEGQRMQQDQGVTR